MKAITTQQNLNVVNDSKRLAAVLSPLRQELLKRLQEPDSASGLSQKIGIPRQKLNYHLRKLEKEGFLELAEERQRRGLVERRLKATAKAFVVDPSLLLELGTDPENFSDKFSSTYLLAVTARLMREVSILRERAEKANKELATVTMQVDVNFRNKIQRQAFTEDLAETLALLTLKYHENVPGSRKYRYVIAGHPAMTKSS